MSIREVSSTDTRNNFQHKLLTSTIAGALAGGGYKATHKNWIYKGLPSDTFVREVGSNLRKNMTSDELKESAKISKFLSNVVDPEVKMETLKPQILDSKELSEAIKATPDETVEQAINRVFAQPKDKAKQDLLDLQFKTKADKKSGRNTAIKLINDNFDAKERKLVKNSETSDKVFDMIKSTARRIQAKAVVATALVTGIAAGALYIVASDVPKDNKK